MSHLHCTKRSAVHVSCLIGSENGVYESISGNEMKSIAHRGDTHLPWRAVHVSCLIGSENGVYESISS
jgi:hypothetical protein